MIFFSRPMKLGWGFLAISITCYFIREFIEMFTKSHLQIFDQGNMLLSLVGFITVMGFHVWANHVPYLDAGNIFSIFLALIW